VGDLGFREETTATTVARAYRRRRDPVLVHLWSREQGLIVPSGNPRGIYRVADEACLRVARR
jgi:molybdate-binding protein